MESEYNQESRRAIQYPQITEEILRRVDTDQEMRASNLDDDSIWDESIDLENAEAMKRIVQEIGWPTVSKVGKKASKAAWLLVQHADHDPEFQQGCLDFMKSEPEGEVEKRDIAFLEDRVRVNTGRPQVYGTQFNETRDEESGQKVIAYGPQPIEDFENLDARRAMMGLGPFEEYRRGITSRYHPHLLDGEGK